MTTAENIRRPSILGDDHRMLCGTAQFVCRQPTIARRILPASIPVKYSLQLSLPSGPDGMILYAEESARLLSGFVFFRRAFGGSETSGGAGRCICRFGDVDHKVMIAPLNGHDLHRHIYPVERVCWTPPTIRKAERPSLVRVTQRRVCVRCQRVYCW